MHVRAGCGSVSMTVWKGWVQIGTSVPSAQLLYAKTALKDKVY